MRATVVSSMRHEKPHSLSYHEMTLTQVPSMTFVKVISWYDNEWGFSCRMLDTTVALMNA